MKKRIVIFSAFLTPLRSGAEACAEEVALRLCDRYDITIITARMRKDLPKKDLLEGKVPVIRVGFGIPFDKWLYPLLAPFAARKLKPDVIHAILETFAGVALHMCKVVYPRAKQILTLQTTNRNFLRGHILRTPNVVTAISGFLIRQAAELGRKDVVLIPNGIPFQEIRNVCDYAQKVRGRVLFVGRLEQMKGVDILLQSMRMVPEPWTLHIVGDGSERGRLEQLSARLNIAGQTIFTGKLEARDLFREYAEAEIFCGLSRSEALGNVFLEAQAAGCVMIATRVGGVPEIVIDGKSGFLVPPEAPAEAARCIANLLQAPHKHGQYAAFGTSNAQQFDWGMIVQRYAALY